MIKGFLVAIGIAASGGASAQMTDVSDLRFVGISLIESSDSRNVDLLGKRMPSGRKVLRAELSTETDMIEIAQRKRLNVYSRIAICGTKPRDEIRQWGTVYFEDFTVTGVAATDEEKRRYREIVGARQLRAPYLYHVYLEWNAEPWSDVDPSKPIHKAYDLASAARDVCVTILGGAMWGTGGLKTNTVTIPKEAIRAALRSLVDPKR